jgi:hypothetical protein
MTERLDLQRPPSKVHARKNSRLYRRGYETLPHKVWGDELGGGGTPPPGGGEPEKPADGSLAPGEIVWWHRTSDGYRGVSVGPPATGSIQYLVESDTGTGGQTVYSAGAPVNASTGWTYPGDGTYHATLYVDNAGELGAVLSTHTFVVTGSVTQEDEHVRSPGNFTIDQIKEWVDEHPVLAQVTALRDHEADRPTPRVSLLDWLDGFIEDLDGVDP